MSPGMEQNLGRDLFGVRLDAGDAVGTSLKRCCVQSNLLIFYSNNVKYSPVILDKMCIRDSHKGAFFVAFAGKDILEGISKCF